MLKLEKVNQILELQEQNLDLEEIAEQVGYEQEGRKKVHAMTRFMKSRKYKLIEDKYIADDKLNTDEYTKKDVVVAKPLTQSKIVEMVKLDSEIKEMLEYIKDIKNNKTEYNEQTTGATRIVVDLEGCGVEEQRTTFRINKQIYDSFINLCDDNKHLLKKDIISIALKEFVEKYEVEKDK